jgi:hypothetical protein
MNAPSIPLLEPHACPDCGLPLREKVKLCPQCGARVKEKATSGISYWVRFFGAVMLALLIPPIGFVGAYFLLVSLVPSMGGGLTTVAIGLAIIGVAVLLYIAATRLLKR